MKYAIFILSVSMLLFNCTSNPTKKNEEKITDATEDLKDSVSSVKPDHTITQNNTAEIDSVARQKNNPKNKLLREFLMEPINLSEFKNSYGPSNSGAGCREGIQMERLYKPEEKGFYYSYMLFHTLLGEMRFLDSTSRMSEWQLFDAFQIYVYHYGKTGEFDFFDNNEILIGLKCAGSHKALGKANLVGKTVKDIEELFGNEYRDLGSIIIYEYKNRVLSLKLKSNRVEWFKYYHLSSMLENENIPDALLKLNR